MDELRTPRILWGALSFSTVLFLVVLYQTRGHAVHELEPMFPPLFALIGLGTAVASFVVPNMQYRQFVSRKKLMLTDEPDPGASSDVIPYRNAPTRKVFANPAEARRVALIVFQTTFILGMALSEAVALYGFSLAFLGHPIQFWLPFFLVAWVLFALRFPTEKSVFGRFASAYGAAFPR
jgi:hypothetical protein